MKVRVRRRIRRPPDLTSLFDVLFIVVFVALIRAAAAQHAEAEAKKPPPKPAPPQPPADLATLKARALASITSDLEQRTPLVIRVSEQGVVTLIEADGKQLKLDVPLLEANTDPTVRKSYLGDRSAELRLCRVAALNLSAPDLARYMVIIAPARAPEDLQEALIDGLERDIGRCLVEQRGLATIVEPAPPPAKP